MPLSRTRKLTASAGCGVGFERMMDGHGHGDGGVLLDLLPCQTACLVPCVLLLKHKERWRRSSSDMSMKGLTLLVK